MVRPGEVFAGFQVERELGRGGMGAVYLAGHPRLPRLVALKVLGAEMALDAEGRARFERESDVVTRLDHPNVVTVYDRGVEGEHLWIAMRFVDGVDASQIPRGSLTPQQAVLIARETARALDYAHAVGVVHRDVKPGNILLARPEPGHGERVLLTDFGIARLRDDAKHLTRTGTFLATLSYASPEQLSALPLDGRADQYSLACTLYCLLTGAPPFDADSATAVIAGHLHHTPPPLSSRRADLPPALDAVLARALAKRPEDRFGGCVEFTDAAMRALDGSSPTPRAEMTSLGFFSEAGAGSGFPGFAKGTAAEPESQVTPPAAATVWNPVGPAPAQPGVTAPAGQAPPPWTPPGAFVPSPPSGPSRGGSGYGGGQDGSGRNHSGWTSPGQPPAHPAASHGNGSRTALLLGAAAVTLVVVVATIAIVAFRASNADSTGAAAATLSTGAAATTQSTSGGAPVSAPPRSGTVNCTYRTTSAPAAKPTDKPPASTTAGEPVEVTLDTRQGSLELTLDTARSPCTVNSFVSLATQGYFDDTSCHRITTGSSLKVVQCGDPTATGTGVPGYAFDDEYPTDQFEAGDPEASEPIVYPRGTVAMANAGPGTNGSQFFLVWGDSQLPPNYTIFGTVSEDTMSTLDRMATGGQDESNGPGDGRPAVPVVIERVTVG